MGTSSEDPQSCAGGIHLSKDHRNLPSRGLSCPGAIRDPTVTMATPISRQRWHCGCDKVYVTIIVVKIVTVPKLLNPLW